MERSRANIAPLDQISLAIVDEDVERVGPLRPPPPGLLFLASLRPEKEKSPLSTTVTIPGHFDVSLKP